MNRTASTRFAKRLLVAGSITAVAALTFTACSTNSSDAAGADPDAVGVSLIVKTTANPFFVAMQDGAKAAAESAGEIGRAHV